MDISKAMVEGGGGGGGGVKMKEWQSWKKEGEEVEHKFDINPELREINRWLSKTC